MERKAHLFRVRRRALSQTQIEKAQDVAPCSYCGQSVASIEIGDLSERIHSAFESHYECTASEPDSYQNAMLGDKESNYEWEREGEPAVYAIMNAADIPEEAAEDIRVILEDENSTFDDAAIGEEINFGEVSTLIAGVCPRLRRLTMTLIDRLVPVIIKLLGVIETTSIHARLSSRISFNW